jgi:hypothetical protein
MTTHNLTHHIATPLAQNVLEIHLQVLLGQTPPLLPLVRTLDIERHLRLPQKNLVRKLRVSIQRRQIHLDRAAVVTKLRHLRVQLRDIPVHAKILREDCLECVHFALQTHQQGKYPF